MKLAKVSCVAASALAVMALAGQTVLAADTYYRWNDGSGTPVNSDRPPPPGIEYEVVSKKNNRTNMSDSEEPQTNAGVGSSRAGSGASTAAATAAPEKDPEICAGARANLETLNTHARIRVPDGEGNYRYIGEEEKLTERANAEKLISQHCD